ncbi:MAG: acyltransferase [Butyrivibrio sp.]|uniref:acyltransferase family protein n=1 Tax=Butyrivibrio sp. TaxID=28121 RepID=UPI001EB9A57A|nr:acyltransferase family protein [Butyrivibrio sp.]MBE5841760.1 acyltransferase [Butyrivibrio sp.]
MNTFLYLIKFIASMCVIAIHTRFSGVFGDIVDATSRFAVPFFFAVSGRFLVPHDMTQTPDIRRKVGKSLVKTLKLTFVVYLVYSIYSLIYHLCIGESFLGWLSSKYNLSEARWFFLFNSGKFVYDGSFTFDHMWYLFALIYVYGLIYIFAPVLRKWYKALIGILLFFLFFGQLLQNYYPIRPFGISVNTWYVMRNWLFVGMPFVLMGILFSDYVASRKEALSDTEYKSLIVKWALFGKVVIFVGLISGVIEFIIFGKKEVYLGSLLIVIGILFLSECGITGGRYLWKIGKEGSSNIYFYHVLVISLLDQLSNMGYIPVIPMNVKPVLIMVICILLVWLIPSYILSKRKIK